MDLDFDLSFWPGRVSGSLDSVYCKDERISAHYQLQTDLQLGRLTALLHHADLLPPETDLAGTVNLQASGYTEENRVVVRELDSRIHDFTLRQGGNLWQDSAVHLFTTDPVAGEDVAKAVRALELVANEATFFGHGGGNNLFDPANRRIVLRDLGLTADLGSLHIARLQLEDWQQIPATLSLQVAGKADLGRLTPVLHQNGLLPSAETIAGRGSFDVELAGREDGQQTAVVKVDIAHASVRREGTVLVADEPFHFNSSLQGKLLAGDIDFDSVSLQFAPLSVQARGRLQRTGEKPYFSLAGEVIPGFSSLAALLNNLYGTDIRAVGNQPETFSLHYPLTQATAGKYRDIRLTTALHARYIAHSGIEFRELSMPLVLEQGVLQAALTGGVNRGTLKLSPRIDYRSASPQLTLPEAEQVLTDVQLEQSLVDGVFKRIHPLLGQLATPRGTISARMDRFSWPLVVGGARQAEFRTVFNLSKVKLTPDGVLRQILARAGIADQPLTLQQSEITCNGAEGRISCTPLKILVADSEMTLGGSVGFDGSLDYLLELPVTRKLVGREGYRVLEGTTLKVPIRGSSEQAIFDPDALSQAISDLLGQAAGKAIEEQVNKLLPGLIDGIIGN